CAVSLYSITMRKLLFLFFTDPVTTEIYTLSLHDALPICVTGDDIADRAAGDHDRGNLPGGLGHIAPGRADLPAILAEEAAPAAEDRKSTRLNSSHVKISYAVFCLKKKKNRQRENTTQSTQ